jgi:hypothetical protein
MIGSIGTFGIVREILARTELLGRIEVPAKTVITIRREEGLAGAPEGWGPQPGQTKEGPVALGEGIPRRFLFLGGPPGLHTKGDTDLPYR